MTVKIIRSLAAITVAIAMVFQPLSYSNAKEVPSDLAPDNVFAEAHSTPGSDAFSRSVLSDMEFFSFAIFVYQQIIAEGKDISALFEGLGGIPYWQTSRIKSYLAKDFIEVGGDILIIKFRNGNAVRVFPTMAHTMRDDGAIEDGVVPRFRVIGDRYTIQYITAANAGRTPLTDVSPEGVDEIYLRIWEKALPYYEKARPADVMHVSWMMKEASRIARVAGLDANILLPIIILHDVGYAACMSDEHARAFEADVKKKHMQEGAKIARVILDELGYDKAAAERVVRYVSVHDNWKFGDNSPFRECVEMGVFQDLDFTWMATREGFESARTQILGMNPRQMFDFIVNDDKHDMRPFATRQTRALYEELINERRRELDEPSGAAQAMIGYGPMVSYDALKIAPDIKGVYITAEQSTGNSQDVIAIVCRAKPDSTQRAKDMAEMINQVLLVMNMELDGTVVRPKTAVQTYIAQHLRQMKWRLADRKIAVETAYDLKANSARYGDKLVFNDSFLGILYKMWHSHRVEVTPEKMREEMGALWMLAERLFHELDHDADEVEQVFKDRMFYRAVISEHALVRGAVAMDAAMPVEYDGLGKKAPFGKAFHSDEYFSLIRRIASITDAEEIRLEIKRAISEMFRHNSSKEILGLSDEKIRAASAMLAAHGINDDLFGERIFNRDFGRFFMERSLFSVSAPYFDAYVERNRQEYVHRMWNDNVDGIKQRLLALSRAVGTEEETARWIENRLALRNITGKDSVRKKLYPVMVWASHVVNPQNYEKRSGRLFGDIYYEGLNLMTIPIFPLDKDGEIDWGLLYWAYQDAPSFACRERGPPNTGLPTHEYFRAKKISIYEYLITHDMTALSSAKRPGADRENDMPRQLSLFDELPAVTDTAPAPDQNATTAGTTDDGSGTTERREEHEPTLFDFGPGAEDTDPSGNAIEYPVTEIDAASAADGIKHVHGLTMAINVAPTLDKVTHILVESSIPAHSQQDILAYLNKRSRNDLASEKIYFLEADAIATYIADNHCTRENTVVLLSDGSKLGEAVAGVNALVVKKDGATDFVNIDGLLGAARCVLNRDWDSFRDIYSALTGTECPEIKPEWMADPAELAKHLIISLPPVRIMNVNDQQKLNGMLKEALVAA